MKTLYILRHSQTLPSSENGDKARELTPKGLEDATALGKLMKQKGYTPDFALCSTAIRTGQTLAQVMNSLETVPIEKSETLYYHSASHYIQAIQEIEGDPSSILIVAHNPSIYEMVILLSGKGEESAMQRLMGGYAPGTLSVLSCPIDNWADLTPAANEITDLLEVIDYNAEARPTRWT